MVRLRIIPVFLMLAVVAAVGAAAQSLPELTYEKFELPNGLDVILHVDSTVPAVAVNLWYHVGSKNEKPGRTGFAHLFEHMMFQGSENSPEDYINKIETMGGEVNASTFEDKTYYYEVVPSNYLENVLFLESDRLGFLPPAMTQEKLDNQRDVVKNERRQRLDNEPYGKSYELLLELMFPEESPYHWSVIGSMEDLSAASLDDVKEFFRQYYVPNNVSLCIAGSFDPAKAKQWVEKYFGPLPAGAPIDRMKAWIPKLDAEKRAIAEDRVSLARLYYHWHTPGLFQPGDAEFDLLANILASGKTSRLYKSLVYDKQIAQDISVYQDSRELSGEFAIEVTVRDGHTLEEAEAAVDAELQKLIATGVTAEELKQAQTIYEANFVRSLQEANNKAEQLNEYNTLLGNPNMFQWDLDRYSKATPAGVHGYIKEYIGFDNRAVLHIVPQGEYSHAELTGARTAPAVAQDPAFTPPDIQRATLKNGLELYVVEDHRLPLVQFNLVLKSGWAADPANLSGLGSMTAELLDEGTKTKDALQISEQMKSLGASFGTSSAFDASFVSLNVLKKNLDPALTLMSEIVLNPTFPTEELERRRQMYLGRIQQEANEPVTSAFKAYYRLLYGENHPYGQPHTGSGTQSSITALKRDDLQLYYTANYMPNNAALVIVGDLTMAEAQARAEKFFGSWKPGIAPNIEVPAPPMADKPRIYIVHKPGAVQSVVVAGHPAMPRSSRDFVVAQVINNALGGQFASRINLNLREEKGYTYGAGSAFSSRRGVGPFLVYAPVQSQSTKESIAEIVKELQDVTGSRPLTQEELAKSKDNLVKSFPQDFQILSGIANLIGMIPQYGLSEDEWKTYIQRVTSVDASVAAAKAKDFIHPNNLVIVVVGDREKIEAPIRELGIGEVVPVEAAQL